MSKIVTAINAMVSHPELITDVIKGTYETEHFFMYANKHKWSIYKTKDNEYFLNFYPENQNLRDLASLPDEAWHQHGPELVSYGTNALATKEALESFKELYSLVSEKVYGMDEILNDIIGDDMF